MWLVSLIVIIIITYFVTLLRENPLARCNHDLCVLTAGHVVIIFVVSG